MKLKYAQVIGLNTDQKAAQTIFNSQDEENAFLAILQLGCDDAFTRGRQTLIEAADFYFDFDGSPAQKLVATFEETQKKFQDAESQLLLAAISGKVLYLIAQGEVAAFLKREGKISDLLSLGSPKQLISGFLNEMDKVLLSTKSFSLELGEDLSKSLDTTPEEFEQDLSDKVGTLDSASGEMAALLIETQKTESSEGVGLATEDQSTAQVSEDEIPEAEVSTKAPRSWPSIKLATIILSKIFQKFPSSGRSRLVLAVILIVIIGAGIGLKFIKDSNAKQETVFKNALTEAENNLNTAKSLQSLNPSEARAKLESAKSNLNKATAIKPKDSRAQKLKEQIESESDSILQQFQTQNFPEFLDLNLIKKDFQATNLTLSGGNLLLLDPIQKSLVSINLDKKSNQIIAGTDQIGEGLKAALSDSLAFVYSKDKGVLKIDITNQKVTTVAKPDENWGQVITLMPFSSNVYLLDSSKNKIWKYVPTAGGYSEKREYLTSGTEVDLSKAVAMQIDSAIYALTSDGQILKFLRGAKDNFTYEGLDKGVKDPKSFFVSSDSENLYVLDSGNQRLLILTKTGSYKGQIEGEKFGSATDLVVDEKGKKVYLLEGSKIYSVDLK
ncbi:hypothetical protein A3B45_02785 [Candidatus Daviesbacteria bacterium RIFCSPLOWO2_01_FULL_39_12]|uniref:Uncharacterized protein n=1 Tax=Candidatus Daviesbacteria bacterium RIFCSPLOWO2_01_FULL_39_12 TaxID=1797785 RepID=A0A1F5KTI5_9BACT|nr:MAG: hypothetical protein A3D79_02435 [Candidatus Daviesbacteria bacterium RIFCSPHIGHO2_02_FULL_39_8]OGE43931.1 MAG: hypothetical protein A3B45_02785 [Candidatus Daviesbacteria bacterium RIFCSPLOWO2_01_FULL_39_12]